MALCDRRKPNHSVTRRKKYVSRLSRQTRLSDVIEQIIFMCEDLVISIESYITAPSVGFALLVLVC